MLDVVVAPPLGLTRLYWQEAPSAVQHPDLALLIDAQPDRTAGRVHVPPDDAQDFLMKEGSLERLNVSVRWGYSP